MGKCLLFWCHPKWSRRDIGEKVIDKYNELGYDTLITGGARKEIVCEAAAERAKQYGWIVYAEKWNLPLIKDIPGFRDRFYGSFLYKARFDNQEIKNRFLRMLAHNPDSIVVGLHVQFIKRKKRSDSPKSDNYDLNFPYLFYIFRNILNDGGWKDRVSYVMED